MDLLGPIHSGLFEEEHGLTFGSSPIGEASLGFLPEADPEAARRDGSYGLC